MLDVLFVGFISACFTNFFDDIIQEGMILEKYGKFIENKPIFKPLGGCLICTIPSLFATMVGFSETLPAVPPWWKVLSVNCVPGSPIDCAAITPTASPM